MMVEEAARLVAFVILLAGRDKLEKERALIQRATISIAMLVQVNINEEEEEVQDY